MYANSILNYSSYHSVSSLISIKWSRSAGAIPTFEVDISGKESSEERVSLLFAPHTHFRLAVVVDWSKSGSFFVTPFDSSFFSDLSRKCSLVVIDCLQGMHCCRSLKLSSILQMGSPAQFSQPSSLCVFSHVGSPVQFPCYSKVFVIF